MSQGKHTVGILKKFNMTECKTTMMDLKKMNDDDSDKIDPRLNGSLMYLVNTRPDSCYTVVLIFTVFSHPAIYPNPGFNHTLSLQMFNALSQY
jgi:hypothetical protein